MLVDSKYAHISKNRKLKKSLLISCLSLQERQQCLFHCCFSVQSGIKLFFTNTMSIFFVVFAGHHNFVIVWTVSKQLPSFPRVTNGAAQQDKQNKGGEKCASYSEKNLFQHHSVSVDLKEKKFTGTYFCGSRTDTGRWAGTSERSSASSRSLKPGNKVFPPVRTMFW